MALARWLSGNVARYCSRNGHQQEVEQRETQINPFAWREKERERREGDASNELRARVPCNQAHLVSPFSLGTYSVAARSRRSD